MSRLFFFCHLLVLSRIVFSRKRVNEMSRLNKAETISASLGMTREAWQMEKFLVLGSFLTLIFSYMYKGDWCPEERRGDNYCIITRKVQRHDIFYHIFVKKSFLLRQIW
ncbi:hypothetical protein AV540_25145 [Brevibacillus parabrevis]|nr:hypothetical protein AV540_25145 [Brevibacillus parabrevis]